MSEDTKNTNPPDDGLTRDEEGNIVLPKVPKLQERIVTGDEMPEWVHGLNRMHVKAAQDNYKRRMSNSRLKPVHREQAKRELDAALSQQYHYDPETGLAVWGYKPQTRADGTSVPARVIGTQNPRIAMQPGSTYETASGLKFVVGDAGNTLIPKGNDPSLKMDHWKTFKPEYELSFQQLTWMNTPFFVPDQRLPQNTVFQGYVTKDMRTGKDVRIDHRTGRIMRATTEDERWETTQDEGGSQRTRRIDPRTNQIVGDYVSTDEFLTPELAQHLVSQDGNPLMVEDLVTQAPLKRSSKFYRRYGTAIGLTFLSFATIGLAAVSAGSAGYMLPGVKGFGPGAAGAQAFGSWEAAAAAHAKLIAAGLTPLQAGQIVAMGPAFTQAASGSMALGVPSASVLNAALAGGGTVTPPGGAPVPPGGTTVPPVVPPPGGTVPPVVPPVVPTAGGVIPTVTKWLQDNLGIGSIAELTKLVAAGGVTAAAIAGLKDVLDYEFDHGTGDDVQNLADAQKEAGRLQYEAAQRSIQAWEEYRATAGAATSKWREHGEWAIDQIREGIESGRFAEMEGAPPEFQGFSYEDLEEDEGYLFRRKQGERAIARNQNLLGGTRSGAFGTRITEFNQELASQEYDRGFQRALQRYGAERQAYSDRVGAVDRHVNRLTGLADRGQSAVQQYLGAEQTATERQTQMDVYGAEAKAQAGIGYHNVLVEERRYRNQLEAMVRSGKYQMWGSLIGGIAGLGFSAFS